MKTKKIIKLIILFVSIAYISHFFYKNWNTIEIGFRFNKLIIGLILILSLSALITYAYRLKIILDKCAGTSPLFWNWFKIIILGRFLNLIFSQMGNIYRGIELKKNYQISYTNYISTFVSFVWMDLCLNLIISEFVIVFLNPDIKICNYNITNILLLIVLFTFLSPIFAKFFLQLFFKKFRWFLWINSKLTEVLTITLNNLKDFRYMTKFILLGLFVLAQTLAGYFLLFLSFEIKLSFPTLIIFYTLLKFSTFVVITPGNMGIQEIAFGFLGEQMGIGMAQGILVSAVGRVISTSIIILSGIIFGGVGLLKRRKEYTKENELIT